MSTTSGAGTLANTLLTSLTVGKTFTIPAINLTDAIYGQPTKTGPLYDAVSTISLDDLTDGQVDGTGVFDRLMTSLVAHLKVEYTANRISGAEYTKAYIGIIQAALQTSSQFVLAKDQAYWGALLAQAQARTADIETVRARLELETARTTVTRTQYEAATAEANYGLSKIRIATEDATYGNLFKQGQGISYTNTNILPSQDKLIKEQAEAQRAQTSNNRSDGAVVAGMIAAQKEMVLAQTEGVEYTNTNILPNQEKLLKEQVEVQRAQTMDTRSDGESVKGTVGKQKDLYTQQVTSYQRDAETKAVKIWTDAWITQKTIDEGLLAPDQFTNTNINSMLTKMRTNLTMT